MAVNYLSYPDYRRQYCDTQHSDNTCDGSSSTLASDQALLADYDGEAGEQLDCGAGAAVGGTEEDCEQV